MALEDTSVNLTGETCYKKAIHALEQAKLEKQEREAQRSKEQFEAWQKAQQAQHQQRPANKGVAVIKTIAKQARQRRNEEEEWMDQARFWMNKAGLEHGHAEALVRLGNDALDKAKAGVTKEEDVKKAMEFYELAGTNGSVEGWFNLGHLLWTGYPNQEEVSTEEEEASDEPKTYGGIKPDKKEALKAFCKSIEMGDRDAMFFVGVQLLSDENEDTGIDCNSHTERCQKGLDLIEKAASLEHAGALYYLCLLHLNGHDELHIPPCTPEEFVRRLDIAADAGDSDALFLRGHCFYKGEEGYCQNLNEAFQNFLAAAKAGHSDAAVSAGAMLHQGVGVKRDQRRAFDLYQMAGELGNVEGWRNVVACYALGEGVPQSHEMAKYIAKTVLRDA
jgi:TPR repeat protein